MSYIVGHPIKSPVDFYGREKQLKQFFSIIGGNQGQSVNILGQKRSGKTSFLLHVSHPAVMVRYLRRPEKMVMVYVDMAACKKPAHFYYRVLSSLKFSLGYIANDDDRAKPSLEETTIYDLEGYLRQFPERRIILLLDDFDQLRIADKEVWEPFFHELRSLASIPDYDLAYITATYCDLFRLGDQIGLPYTSPFYNIFYPVPVYLGGVDPEAIEPIICKPALQMRTPFSACDVAGIKYLAGSFPFFLQATASKWLSQKQFDYSPDIDVIKQQMLGDLTAYFAQWWSQFDTCQKNVLYQLAYGFPLIELPFSQYDISQATVFLRQYGFIIEMGMRFAINGALFQTWIKENVDIKLYVEDISLDKAVAGIDPLVLRDVLTEMFNLDELHTLCFDLGVDFEDLPGLTKTAKARSLVNYWSSRKNLDRLAEAIRVERGQVI